MKVVLPSITAIPRASWLRRSIWVVSMGRGDLLILTGAKNQKMQFIGKMKLGLTFVILPDDRK